MQCNLETWIVLHYRSPPKEELHGTTIYISILSLLLLVNCIAWPHKYQPWRHFHLLLSSVMQYGLYYYYHCCYQDSRTHFFFKVQFWMEKETKGILFCCALYGYPPGPHHQARSRRDSMQNSGSSKSLRSARGSAFVEIRSRRPVSKRSALPLLRHAAACFRRG